MDNKFRIIFIIFFCLCNSLLGQDRQLIFKHLSLNEGLSQSPIFSIKQDKLGLIWIGSRRGLVRYDGYEFKLYVNSDYDKRNIRQRDINALCIDSKNNIWLGTTAGLYRFNRRTEAFTYLPIKGISYVSTIIDAGNDTFWMGTDAGIKLINCKNSEVKAFSAEIANGLFVYSLYKDKQGNLWAGTNKGLKSYNAVTGYQNTLPFTLKEQLEITIRKIVAIEQDSDGDLWFGTEDSGLFWFQKSTLSCRNFTHSFKDTNSILSDFIRDIHINAANELWIGTRNGLSIFNKYNIEFNNHIHRSEIKGSLSHNTIWNIMKDFSGSIWLTTYAGGINVYNPANTNFSNIEEREGFRSGLNQPLVNAIYVDSKDAVWAGTDGGGLNYFDKKANIAKYYSIQDPAKRKNSNIIKALYKDKSGALWLGTLDGLARFQSGKVQYVQLDPDKESHNVRVNSVFCTDSGVWAALDADGLRYIGFDGRVSVFRYDAHQNSICSNYTNCVMQLRSGEILVGTNEGASILNPQSFKFKTYRNSGTTEFAGNAVISAFQDSKGRIWLGTRAGLKLLDRSGKAHFLFTEKEGLVNNAVQSITEDLQGNLWVSTSNGVSKISFQRNVLNITRKDFNITNYTDADGLASNQWMPNAVFRSNSGEIFLGGVNGITFFRPESILINKFPPSVAITDFSIHNRPVNVNSEDSPLGQPVELISKIVLKHNQGSISFKFAALNFVNSHKNTYAYKMEGLAYNDNWNYTYQRSAVYTSLEPGKYIFKVKAANNDGLWSQNPRTIQITVLPPFWLTWWAYLIYTISAFIVFYLTVRFFRRQAKLERDLFYEHLQFERQQELHQLKLSFFTNISHEIRTPLTLIAAPVEKLIEETKNNSYLNKQLQMIQNNTNRLLKLVNELMDFRKTETGNMKLQIRQGDISDFSWETFLYFEEQAEVKSINYKFEGLEHDTQIYFDHDQLEKVILNLLSNAFKFAREGGMISLSLTEDETSVHISVVDNGPGIPYEDQGKLFNTYYQGEKYNPRHQGTGIGLALSKSIIALHHGKLTFQSIPEGLGHNSKTTFTITLLKGLEHFSANEIKFEDQVKDSLSKGEVTPVNTVILTDSSLANRQESPQSILVVEDNDEVREFIIASLKDYYNLIGTENGVKGLAAALEGIPDLIITDVMMPEMDGMELCRRIKEDERTSHIPVILLTARSADVHYVSGLEKGADAYISKPFSLQVLTLTIKNLLSSRSAMQRKFSQQVTLQPKDVIIPSTDGKFLNKLLEIIEEKLENPDFGVAELAREIGMSQPVLYRKIKALSDLSVADFIKSIRLKKAAMFLSQNKMSIADVAFAVGFNNRKYFSKEFRKQYNQSPSEFINEHIKNASENISV